MDVLSTALTWRSLGIATIPCLHRSKRPALDCWKPYQTRLPTEFELRAWFSNPGYNLAVITGWQGLVIVDWDNKEKHDKWFYDFSIELEILVWTTFNVVTPRGLHYYFYCDEPAQCTKLDGVDIKAAGGYCLTPPSVHPSGDTYHSAACTPADIQHINSITDILPEYQQAVSKAAPCPQASTLDPLDAAWLPYTSTTIEEANAKLDYEQLLNKAAYHISHYLCPFHEDTAPSLKVYSNGSWYCFGCHVSGRDKLDLYAKLNGMTIREALCTL